MKTKIFIFLLLMLTVNLNAQNSITVSGLFKEGDSRLIVQLGKEANKLLFSKTKGNLFYTEFGNYMELSSADAQKLKTDRIIVISLTGWMKQSNKDTVIITLFPLCENRPEIYYTKENTVNNHITIRNDFFENPSKTDTLKWEELNDYRLFYNTRKWIENLDNSREVTVESQIYKSLTDGTCTGGKEYKKMPIKELAKVKLRNIYWLFGKEIGREWNKEQWLNWFDTLMSKPTICKENIFNQE